MDDVQVVGLGQACVDCLGTLPVYPPEDGKIELEGLSMQCGGPAATALVTLSRLGVITSFIGSVSDDFYGRKISGNLQDKKVDTSFLKVTPGHSSQFAFIAITESGLKRTIFWHRGSAPHLSHEDIDLSMFKNACVLHVDGLMVEACIEAAQQAKELGMLVMMDGGTMREGTSELISLVDILIACETFSTPMLKTGNPIEAQTEMLREMGPRDVVITLGAKGSVGLNDKGIHYQDAFKVNARDTTGAGDVYHGAYIFGLLQNWDMPQCMQFASAVAALKCQEIGAQSGIPEIQTVNDFLALQI
jgi:sulfofructose kinase